MNQRTPRSVETQWSVWMRSAQGGDKEAYERLLISIVPELRAFVRSRLRDPATAEDVVQNVLLSIHRARHTYRPERAFAPWMFTIARNALIDAHRSRALRQGREIALESVNEPIQPEASTSDSPLAPHLVDALQELPPIQREAVELIQLQGLSVAEAAVRAGTTPGALKVRAHRGYRALRALLGKSEE